MSVLKMLKDCTLLTALASRRTRRVARGQSISPADLKLTADPGRAHPLTSLEEAILIGIATGLTGVTTHDGPLVKKPKRNKTKQADPELGTPFLNIRSGAAASADNCRATVFFMINDDGIFLLKPLAPAGLDALRLDRKEWTSWTADDWIRVADKTKVRVGKERLDFPRQWPYYLGWNAQHSNVKGTTIFFPLVDCTWQYINALLILAGERKHANTVFLDDWRSFRPRTLREFGAKILSAVGAVKPIPYQPIGGLKSVPKGFDPKTDMAIPLGFGHTLRTDYGTFFELQNLMLVGEAMGLGGWIHSSVLAPYVYQRDAAKGWYGLGFRMEKPKKRWNRWPTPPMPASRPNPVGIDNVLPGLCPPYVASMDEAVDRVMERKYADMHRSYFGDGGSYADKDGFARPYAAHGDAQTYLEQASQFAEQDVKFVKQICNYIYKTYGRFPAHVDAFYSPGVWLQFSHVDLDYYDKVFKPEQYERQTLHASVCRPPVS